MLSSYCHGKQSLRVLRHKLWRKVSLKSSLEINLRHLLSAVTSSEDAILVSGCGKEYSLFFSHRDFIGCLLLQYKTTISTCNYAHTPSNYDFFFFTDRYTFIERKEKERNLLRETYLDKQFDLDQTTSGIAQQKFRTGK